MRIILCCLALLFSVPAFANSVEDGLCHAQPQSVETMQRTEKLCRTFVRAMDRLPGDALKEVQVMLSPGEVWHPWRGSHSALRPGESA